jgi:protein-disulfide isomerase
MPRLRRTPSFAGRAATLILAGLLAGTAAAAGAPIARIGSETLDAARLDAETAAGSARIEEVYARQKAKLESDRARALDDLRLSTAERLVDEAVVAREAAAAGTTPEAVLARAEPGSPTRAEVEEFYAAEGARTGQSLEALEEQIRSVLQRERDERARRALLDGLREKYGARVLLEPARAEVAARGPARGPERAPVTIVEFADFECPFCRRTTRVLAKLQAAYPTQVRVVFRHLPLSEIHPHARDAARASVCAEEHGRFWPVHDALFTAATLDAGSLRNAVTAAGVDPAALDACLATDVPDRRLADDLADVRRLAVETTPTLFVNGRYLQGAPAYSKLERIVKDELQRRGAPADRSARN